MLNVTRWKMAATGLRHITSVATYTLGIPAWPELLVLPSNVQEWYISWRLGGPDV